jgi:triosephosphate isomerase
VSLTAVREQLTGSPVRIGAQNMYFEPKGAYTGEIRPVMLLGLFDYVILGHSERRHVFGETDDLVQRKLSAAFAHDLLQILCVGETLAENDAGQTDAVIRRQLESALVDVADPAGLVIAYEPVWAIGTGRPATPEGANTVMATIRILLAERLGPAVADNTRILYGGSVSPDNFESFMAQSEIDGGLVGGASLVADGFVALARQAAQSLG